jgi:hypothetical protein
MVLQLPEPDAADQAVAGTQLDPTSASRAEVDAARARERAIREDQQRRDAEALLTHGYAADSYEVRLVRYASTEPGW